MTPFTVQQLLAQASNHLAKNEFTQAESILRHLLTLAPTNPDLFHQTALLCYRQKKFQDAEQLSRSALAIKPSSAHANLLAEILRAQHRLPEAIATLHSSIKLSPSDAQAHYNLGLALRKLNRIDEAISAYQVAAQLAPTQPLIFNNLATALRAQGRLPEAIANFRKSLALRPISETHSNLLYALWFDAGATSEEILREHQDWSVQWAGPLAKEILSHGNELNPSRQLRIGYVSPDFRQHVIALFMQPILHHRNRTDFHITCYADIAEPDFMTARIQQDADGWVPTANMSDGELAQKIRADKIDILIDLTAQMAKNRMLTFARKPAPIQISYLAYAGTTGLPAIDYRLSDPHLDPPSLPPFGPEKIAYLPETYWCYQPQIDLPEIQPRDPNAPLTFVCFNHCAKINPTVIALWSQILRQLPEAILRLVVPGGPSANSHIHNTFARHDIPAHRIHLHDKVNYADYFSLYQDADIALDPFPYNGGTTTLDALYMGIPVITLAGGSGMSRAGVSILTNLNLSKLIAATPIEYVNIALDLARNRYELSLLRGSLREKLKASVLMDPVRFAQNLESVYRSLWQSHCVNAAPAEIS